MLAADDLDRDLVAEERPAGPVDRTHSTLGQQGQNLVAIVEDLARREHGTIRPYRSSSLRARAPATRSKARVTGLGLRPSTPNTSRSREPEPRTHSRYCSERCSPCSWHYSSSRCPRPRHRRSFVPTSGSTRRPSSRSTAHGQSREGHGPAHWRDAAEAGAARARRSSVIVCVEADSPGYAERVFRKLQVRGRRLRARQVAGTEHGAGRRRTARRQRPRRCRDVDRGVRSWETAAAKTATWSPSSRE